MSIYFMGCDMGGWHGRNDACALCQWDENALLAVPNGLHQGRLFYPLSPVLTQVVQQILAEDGSRLVVCIDAALAWPAAFRDLVGTAGGAQHLPQPPFEPRRVADIMNRYLYRQTERFVYNQAHKHPLSAPGDKFGNNSSKAQVLVSQLTGLLNPQGVYRPPFDQWDPARAQASRHTIIEVYPAASVTSPPFGQMAWPDVKNPVQVANLGVTDLDDAKRCAMTGVCYAQTLQILPANGVNPCPNVFLPPHAAAPQYDQATIAQEGWIFFPQP